jgi:glycosyltransferase involved in cell wall biosynthesis
VPTAESETIAEPAGNWKRRVTPLPEVLSKRCPATETLPLMQAASEVLPRVSVVIPTRGRPELAERAVRSVLAQGFEDFEIVVVIDGPDRGTGEMLRLFRDERLHVVHLGETVGGSEARNIGVRFARGRWIAFLDDDDEWYADKLEKQWTLGISMAGRYAFVGSQFLEYTGDAERVLPRRMPEKGELFSEYLFVRRGWQSGEGFLQTSTWFVSRALMLKVPFTRNLKRCQDLDWLLHATALPEVEVCVVPEILAIFHHDESRFRVSRTSDWRFLYSWALTNKRYLTPRAFSFFLATFCVPSAANEREGAASFLFLLRSCLTHGSANGKCLLLFLICWWMPESRRRRMRANYDRLSRGVMRRLSVSERSPATPEVNI